MNDEPNRGSTVEFRCSLHGETEIDYLSVRQNAIGLRCGCAWRWQAPDKRAATLVAVEYIEGEREGRRVGFVPVPPERLD